MGAGERIKRVQTSSLPSIFLSWVRIWSAKWTSLSRPNLICELKIYRARYPSRCLTINFSVGFLIVLLKTPFYNVAI